MTEPQWLNPTEGRAWRGLRRIDFTVLAAIRSDLQADSGLSDADYEVLTNLADAGGEPIRSGQLAAQISWSTSRLSHQLRRMEQRGLVERGHEGDDGRTTNVKLSKAGHDALAAAAPKHAASVRRHLFDRLTEEQVDHLEDIVTALVDLEPPPDG